jgi:ankyrin repeat protein
MPLCYAAENGHEAIVKLLLEMGNAQVNVVVGHGVTALSVARKKGNEAIVKLLQDWQAQVDLKMPPVEP